MKTLIASLVAALALTSAAMAQADPRMGPTSEAVRPLFSCANEHARYLAIATPDAAADNIVLATSLACTEFRDANLQTVMDIWGGDFTQRLVDYIDTKTAELTLAAFADEKARQR